MGASDPVVLFDGVCNLCNGAVQFIIKRDRNAKFRFAALQSEIAHQILQQTELKASDLSTIIVVKGARVFIKSDAALEIARHLDGLWPALFSLKILPQFVRDRVYDWIARNRYRWFGKKDECMIPTPELRQRFLQ